MQIGAFCQVHFIFGWGLPTSTFKVDKREVRVFQAHDRAKLCRNEGNLLVELVEEPSFIDPIFFAYFNSKIELKKNLASKLPSLLWISQPKWEIHFQISKNISSTKMRGPLL